MKAWVLRDIGDIRLEEREQPRLAGGEVLVRVKAAGICASDIPRIYETGAHRMPLVPGHEFSGVVEDVGAEVSPEWISRRVSAFPLIPCRKCAFCRDKRYELCRNYGYIGSRQDGAFAEYVNVPWENLIVLPPDVTYEEGAMLEPMAVAVHAIRRGLRFVALSQDAPVAVCGLGTIGFLVTMFLMEMGCRNLYLIGNHDFQREKARELGVADNRYYDIRKESGTDWLAQRTGGADLFFECAGRNQSASLGLNSVKAGGAVVFVGNPRTDMAFSQNAYWRILRNQIIVTGSWNSSFRAENDDDWRYALEKVSSKRVMPLKLLSRTFPMPDLERNLSVMRQKRAPAFKLMLLPGD